MKAPVHSIRQRVFSHGDGSSRSVAGQSGLAGLTAWQAAFQEGMRPRMRFAAKPGQDEDPACHPFVGPATGVHPELASDAQLGFGSGSGLSPLWVHLGLSSRVVNLGRQREARKIAPDPGMGKWQMEVFGGDFEERCPAGQVRRSHPHRPAAR